MSTPLTNLRVYVQWTEQTVFAGEDIECQITFKNVATTPAPSRASLQPTASALSLGSDRQRRTPASQLKPGAPPIPRPASTSRGHRTVHSLNVPVGSVRSQPISSPWKGGAPRTTKDGSTHKRSVSIISIGPSEGRVDDTASHTGMTERPGRVRRNHGRSASLQIIPRRHGINGGPISGTNPPFDLSRTMH